MASYIRNMKRVIIISLILIVAICGYGQTHTGNWSSYKMSSDSVTEVTSLFFADSVVGYIGCAYEPQPGFPWEDIFRWYKTLDGGLSWTQMAFNGPSLIAQNFGGQPCAPTHNSIFSIADQAPDFTYIIRSLDNGDHWDTIRNNLHVSQFFTMFTEKYGVGIGGTESYPVFMQTFDGGNSFGPSHNDSLFSASLAASGQTNYNAQFSSELHGTYICGDLSINKGNGLTTLVTNNGGNSWEKHHTDFPGYENYDVEGFIQYQKGTPNLWLLPADQSLNLDLSGPRNAIYRTQPDFHISYCFSTDYGVTWGYDTSFWRDCSGFYGVSPGNVWMTLCNNPLGATNPPFPAYKISHTTDFGKSWDIDVSTLINDGKYDAEAIYFTDANHGWIIALHNGMPYIFIYHPLKNSVIENSKDLSGQLQVFPIPAIDQVIINFPSGDLPMQTEVYDIVGRQYFPPYKIFNSSIQIDTHDLPAGIWLAIVQHTYGTNTTRFIIQK
jgi:hypothetical protein